MEFRCTDWTRCVRLLFDTNTGQIDARRACTHEAVSAAFRLTQHTVEVRPPEALCATRHSDGTVSVAKYGEIAPRKNDCLSDPLLLTAFASPDRGPSTVK